MKMKYALCGIVLAAFVTPALAGDKYYVVRDTKTKECSIEDEKPTEASMKIVGKVHRTHALAKKAKKALIASKFCKTN